MNTRLPIDLPPTESELDKRSKPPEPVEVVRRAPSVCIGNCDICAYCANSNNRD